MTRQLLRNHGIDSGVGTLSQIRVHTIDIIKNTFGNTG